MLFVQGWKPIARQKALEVRLQAAALTRMRVRWRSSNQPRRAATSCLPTPRRRHTFVTENLVDLPQPLIRVDRRSLPLFPEHVPGNLALGIGNEHRGVLTTYVAVEPVQPHGERLLLDRELRRVKGGVEAHQLLPEAPERVAIGGRGQSNQELARHRLTAS